MNLSHREPSAWELAFGQLCDGKFSLSVAFCASSAVQFVVDRTTLSLKALSECLPDAVVMHARAPLVARVCVLPVGEVAFPFKRDYDRVNLDVADPRLAPTEDEEDTHSYLQPDPAGESTRGLQLGASRYESARAPSEFTSMFQRVSVGEGVSPSASTVPPNPAALRSDIVGEDTLEGKRRFLEEEEEKEAIARLPRVSDAVVGDIEIFQDDNNRSR